MDVQQGIEHTQLIDSILDLADADASLSEEAKLLVLAALQGDEGLEHALTGVYPNRPTRSASCEQEQVEPAGAFVKSIRVEGFRGVGPKADLPLEPTSGLTIVAGRNGSGKSTFAEAFEFALTGKSYRWDSKRKKSVVWTEHWRNIHHSGSCGIRIDLAEESVGVSTIGVGWADGARKLEDRSTWVQRPGQPREAGLGSLGWERAIELYRPILSYDELGGVLEAGPSELHDALAVILGLEQMTEAQRRLAEAVKSLREPQKTVRAEAAELKDLLAAQEDERATRARTLLESKRPDLDKLQALATGTAARPDGELAKLKLLTQPHLPSLDEVQEVAQRLRDSVARLLEVSGLSIDLVERQENLLRQALELHRHRGDGPCPVCGQGVLDRAWRAGAEAELAGEDDQRKQIRDVRQRLDTATASAHELIDSVFQPIQPGRFELTRLPAAEAAWRRWSQPPPDPVALAQHLEDTYTELAVAITSLGEEATTALLQHQDAWAPHATRLSEFVLKARNARQGEDKLRIAEAANNFMKRNGTLLRNRALEPLAEKARNIWATLRQESNVDLGGVQLDGNGTSRRVKLLAEVDGMQAGALGVMSQGELHALALALFLPRATMKDSPFRFIVLDDPIQAMDPAKVDGLVQVLAELAHDRQVVVMSHDDRLPEAVRRMGVDARILEISRGGNSTVQVVPCLDPAGRYLDDAFALARDDGVPSDVKIRVIPGMCRMAAESAARDAFMTRRLIAGETRVHVESTWQDAKTPSHRIALSLHDDKLADLGPWLRGKPWRRPAHQIITRGAHEGIRNDPLGAVRNVERLVKDLRGMVSDGRQRKQA